MQEHQIDPRQGVRRGVVWSLAIIAVLLALAVSLDGVAWMFEPSEPRDTVEGNSSSGARASDESAGDVLEPEIGRVGAGQVRTLASAGVTITATSWDRRREHAQLSLYDCSGPSPALVATGGCRPASAWGVAVTTGVPYKVVGVSVEGDAKGVAEFVGQDGASIDVVLVSVPPRRTIMVEAVHAPVGELRFGLSVGGASEGLIILDDGVVPRADVVRTSTVTWYRFVGRIPTDVEAFVEIGDRRVAARRIGDPMFLQSSAALFRADMGAQGVLRVVYGSPDENAEGGELRFAAVPVASRSASGRWRDRREFRGRDGVAEASLDAGWYSVSCLDDRYRVSLVELGGGLFGSPAAAVETGSRVQLDVDLVRSVQVSGSIHSGGQPVEDCYVALIPLSSPGRRLVGGVGHWKRGGAQYGVGWRVLDSGLSVWFGRCDAIVERYLKVPVRRSGGFSFRVAPGSYLRLLVGDGWSTEAREIKVEASDLEEVIELQSAGDLYLQAGWGFYAFERIQGAGGDAFRRAVLVRGDGVVSGLPAADYRVSTTGRDGRMASTFLGAVSVEHGANFLDLTELAKISLRGRLGHPSPRQVRVGVDGSSRGPGAIADEKGEFRIDLPYWEPGPKSVFVSAPGFSYKIEVEALSRSEYLDLGGFGGALVVSPESGGLPAPRGFQLRLRASDVRARGLWRATGSRAVEVGSQDARVGGLIPGRYRYNVDGLNPPIDGDIEVRDGLATLLKVDLKGVVWVKLGLSRDDGRPISGARFRVSEDMRNWSPAMSIQVDDGCYLLGFGGGRLPAFVGAIRARGLGSRSREPEAVAGVPRPVAGSGRVELDMVLSDG